MTAQRTELMKEMQNVVWITNKAVIVPRHNEMCASRDDTCSVLSIEPEMQYVSSQYILAILLFYFELCFCFICSSLSEIPCLYKFHLSVLLLSSGPNILYIHTQSFWCSQTSTSGTCRGVGPFLFLRPILSFSLAALRFSVASFGPCSWAPSTVASKWFWSPVTYFLPALRPILFFNTWPSNVEDISGISPRLPLLLFVWFHISCISLKLSHVEELTLVQVFL